MEFKDYYEVLNLEKTAAVAEIETARQNLTRIYDSNPTDPEIQANLQAINEAGAVLTDPEKRARYDQVAAAWRMHQKSGGALPFDWTPWLVDPADRSTDETHSEFYRAVFSETVTIAPTPASGPGRDFNQEIEISLEDAFNGASRILRIGDRRIQIRIPRGAGTGTKIRVRGEGGPASANGPKGDLYLEIKVSPHPLFTREGDDLHLELPVDLYTAVLGGEAFVPMIKGKIKLRIPPETQSGRVFRLKGQGMPRLKQPDERGDLLAKVMVQIPQNLSEEEIALFEELADIRGL